MKRVFIIGAGGSHSYNFPLGNELFDRIRQRYHRHVKNYIRQVMSYKIPDASPEYREAEKFCNLLSKIKGISIDKYLNLNQDYLDIGKTAILMEILHSENSSKLIDSEDDWYEYLFSRMLNGLGTINDIMENFGKDCAFITFNYDRSFENFIYNNLLNILKHEVKEDDIIKLIKAIPIIHIYGKAGYLEWEHPQYQNQITSYGKSDIKLLDHCNLIMNMIELIYEKRQEAKEIQDAQDYIHNSESVYFLGFGFDLENLKILGFPDKYSGNKIYATAYSHTENERKNITKKIVGKSYAHKNEVTNSRYIRVEDLNCRMLLRNYYEH